MRFIFTNYWKSQIHKKSGIFCLFEFIWSFNKADFNPRWITVTILNFEIGFEIREKK